MKLNISWVRVLSATQILSVILFFAAGYVLLKYVGQLDAKSDQNSQETKMEVILLPQSHLSNKDDCVDVVVTKICDIKGCQYHVTSFNVVCKESLTELP